VDQLLNNTRYIDSHAHIDLIKGDKDDIISMCINNNVEYILNVGFNSQSSVFSTNLSNQYNNIFSSIGIHPHYVDSIELEEIKRIFENNINNNRLLAIGEIGLDYIKSNKSKNDQIKGFETQLQIASENNLPVIIHNRNADEDVINTINNFKNIKAIFHCFSSNIEFAVKILNSGHYISFAGNITYIKNDYLRDVLAITPLERLLLETDSPYLSPQNLRGKENNPVNIKYIYSFVSEILNLDLNYLIKNIYNNFFRIFERNTNEKRD